MAHYAKVLDGKVIDSIVAEQEFMDGFVDSNPGEWIQTSYNTRGGVHYESDGTTPSADQSKALRKNFGSRDMEYDSTADAFHSPQPYPSWTLNSTTFLWECPVDEPTATDDTEYVWNEEDQSWDAVE
tara:strand:+ start:38 stop:418 length:381 start_codon:yes stop_codon:yes gene_type:complete